MTVKRPALGEVASLGSLYDARSDTFTQLSLLRTSPPATAVIKTQRHSTVSKFSKTDTYREKFDRMGLDAELSASFLANLVKVEGVGRYLTDKRDSNLVMQASMHYSITTIYEALNLGAGGFKDCLASRTLESDVATHVVTGISWGAQCVITAKREVTHLDDRKQIACELDGALKIIGHGISGEARLTEVGGEQNARNSFEVTVYGDVLADDGLVPTDFESAQRFVSSVHKYIANANNGRGQPLTYTLLPLSILSSFGLLEIKADITIHQLNVECVEKFVQLFEELRNAQQNLRDYDTRIRQHNFCIPPAHIRAVADQLSKVRAAEAALKSDYASVLKDVRAGEADAQRLWRLLGDFRDRESSPDNIMSIARYIEKMEFVDQITAKGAQYIGYQGSSLDTHLANNPHDDTFTLFFNEYVRRHCDRWGQNFALLLELLQDTEPKKLVLAVDCDASDKSLEKSYISQYRSGHLVTEDVLEQRKAIATNCIMRYSEHGIKRSLTAKPLQRRAVKIPCPSSCCSRALRCNWICSRCHSIVEYGYVDDRLYCDCGGCCYDQWEFKCKDLKHGSAWNKYDDQKKLLQLLKALESFEELNILILGETGVGKSTWINAFINYLTFESLDKALDAEDLKSVIPCSFATQFVDKSDIHGRLVQKDIKIGFSKNECDGADGHSATQLTSVYAVDIGNTRVRLIDTPGIGDTRGVEQDNENMADILEVLRNYKNLHGILILLKPNAPRLTVMFRFCIKQLLTHLHRDASKNMVFGFTNTRGSNYKPGDTFKPLERLLNEYNEVKMGLFEHNVYCFDSESFRYLAARKKGVDMGMLENNRDSWKYSVEECKRLVKHFRELKPHQVQSTLNLNEIRHTILRLTQPMALISQKIQSSIAANEDQIKDLRNKEFTKEQLQKKLFVQKDSLTSDPVDEPRTICTHRSCVECRSDFDGREETTIIYKTMCHRPCYLHGVDVNTKGHHKLQHCAAMEQNGNCKCGHSWMEHMHILFEYRPITMELEDKATRRDLIENANEIELEERAIKMRNIAIEEFRSEYRQFQESAIQFGFFLKRHSITPYNDATIEYLDHQIDQERMKIEAGGKKQQLESLRKYRAEHVQKVQILEDAMRRGENHKLLDDNGIRPLLDSLYGLKHYGNDLRRIMTTNERAAEATYREKSYNVSAGNHWTRPVGKQADYHWVQRDQKTPVRPKSMSMATHPKKEHSEQNGASSSMTNIWNSIVEIRKYCFKFLRNSVEQDG